jgi:predicted TIM-barrel fold metal-dependent hydrolase
MTDTIVKEASASTSTVDQPYLVISADSHASPSLEHALRPYCPAKYLQQFDDFVAGFRAAEAGHGEGSGSVADRLEAAQRASRANADDGASQDKIDDVYSGANACLGLHDPHARVQHLDEDGIAADVIFAGAHNGEVLPFLANGFDAGPTSVGSELRSVGSEIWNRWLADFVTVQPERHIGVMQVGITDVDTAVREIRTGHAAGLKGVNLPAPRSDFPSYNDPGYEPLWSVCEELDLPLLTHGGGGEFPLGVGGPQGMQMYLCETEWLARRSLWQLMFGGVFDRHPGLRLVFVEQRAAWVPETLRTLDSIYWNRLRTEIRDVMSEPPSERWKKCCFVGGSFMAPFEAEMHDQIGPVNLLWGSDYPHPEGTWPNTRLHYRHALSALPEEETRKILGTNALAVFDLDAVKLGEIAAKIGPRPSEVSKPLPATEFPAVPGYAFRELGSFS